MRINRWLITVLFSAALVGFADSAYLTAQHVRGVIPPCALLSNCEQVLTSKYATVGPMPVAALGVLYYGALLVLLIAYLDTRNQRIFRGARWLISAGMLASLYFVYVQAFIIKAWCPYCLISTATTAVLFLASVAMMRTDEMREGLSAE